MHVTIRPIDATSESDVMASHRIQTAAIARDIPDLPPPSLADHRGQLLHPWPGQSEHHWIAEVDGEAAGVLELTLPELDNLHLVEVQLTVHPDHRRRGVGRALHAHTVAFAREHGRRTLTASYVTQLPGGPPRESAHAAFADAMGAKPALPEVRRRLDLSRADRASWRRLFDGAAPHAEGYSLVRWAGPAPEEYVADVAALDGRLLLDAPMGDLDIEPMKVDVARTRGTEETTRKRGRRMFSSGARHDATGQLVAWTAIGFDADIRHQAWQQITIVDPAHRGHRLGLLVKIDNLWHTVEHEPQMRDLDTWNAAENSYMIAINETLGFRAVDGWVECQQEV